MEADGNFPETVHVPLGKREMLQHSTIALEQIIRQLDLLKADKGEIIDEPFPLGFSMTVLVIACMDRHSEHMISEF